MALVRISWQGNLFDNMSDRDKEILNLGMNLMAMPEDHPHYERAIQRLNELLANKEDE